MTEQERAQAFQQEFVALQAKYGVQVVPMLERIERLGEVYAPVVQLQFLASWQPSEIESINVKAKA